jgi:HTH-type transcriptional regulator/antitoxin HigA
MDANLVVIDSDAELRRAKALAERLIASDNPEEQAQLAAQARLIAAYEQETWPRQVPDAVGIIQFLMDQHGMTEADLGSLLGSHSHAKDVLDGKKPLTMTMVQRLRARFRVSADLLIPPPMPVPATRTARGGKAKR